jgi:glutamate-1-semialdehyde 2,1-aminomutase
MMEWSRSEELLERARKVIAGGVNSNVRLTAVPRPLFFSHGEGPRITDVDGNVYLDYVLGQGPLIHGHSHPALLAAAASGMQRGMMFAAQHEAEVRLAERICDLVPGAERVRLGSSGSEVIQAAFRIAREHTGRQKIVKFEGHYHGWFDNVLVSVAPPLEQAGPEDAPNAVPGSRGACAAATEDVIVLPWNNPVILEQTLRAQAHEIAAVITEPIMCNVGCILPRPGYLQTLRDLCTELGIVFILDEVITGFRIAPGGAQEYLQIIPDLCTFGKAMAGGFPIACLGGREDLMNLLTLGVNHSGTYNANILVVEASIACLELLTAENGACYRRLFELGNRLRAGIERIAGDAGVGIQTQGPGPMFHVAFADAPLTDYRSATRQDTPRYHRFTASLMERGVRVLERGLWYVSTSHTNADIDETLAIVADVLPTA